MTSQSVRLRFSKGQLGSRRASANFCRPGEVSDTTSSGSGGRKEEGQSLTGVRIRDSSPFEGRLSSGRGRAAWLAEHGERAREAVTNIPFSL